ncbi:MAG: hypothetical protein UX82_C0030G0011 [Microgenomates group bacterium GW2011_GWE1_47_12]|nr:MAG: hypothetical protein UX82_C0030G0011 [Microgenomates group bacterium GW2011_GWE1_47_12]
MSSKFRFSIHILCSLGIISLLSSFFLLHPATLDSANLTSVKDTLQTSRLSWSARIEADGTDEGASRVQIQAAPAVPYNSTSTANLRAGDTIYINANSYTVVGIYDADEFTVSPIIGAGDADDGDPIQLKQTAQHVVSLTSASAVGNGYFRILIPADETTPADGNVDDGGFDFGTGSIDVAATDAGNYDFVVGVATASGGTGCTSPANYHCLEVHYSGNGGVGTAITINIGNTDGTNSLLNPTEVASHTEATADTYTFIVRNYDANNNLVDATPGKIALIESVRVTATVDPTISFTIAGIDTATSACGATPDIDTTTGTNAPLAVPFGTMALNTFKDAAHNLTVSTNAVGGYVVTAVENDQLSKDGLGVTTIPDTDCDGEDCTITSGTEWNTATDNGFGYSLENVDAASISFEYDTTGTTFRAKPFAILDTDTPETLFSSTTVANAENAYVCYRLGVGATQAAGDYENQITYTATGTF